MFWDFLFHNILTFCFTKFSFHHKWNNARLLLTNMVKQVASRVAKWLKVSANGANMLTNTWNNSWANTLAQPTMYHIPTTKKQPTPLDPHSLASWSSIKNIRAWSNSTPDNHPNDRWRRQKNAAQQECG